MKNRVIFLIVTMIMMTACQKPAVPQVDLEEDVEISVYTVSGCGRCDAFETYGIPYLEACFGDQIEIARYDLDEDEARYRYDQTVKKLDGYDEADYGLTPFIAVEKHFAILGYTRGDETSLADDIVLSVRGEPLGEKLQSQRFQYLREE